MNAKGETRQSTESGVGHSVWPMSERRRVAPDRIAIDANGFGWRVWDDQDAWSMVPTNPDNEPIPQPVTWFVPDNRDAQIARTLADALADTERCWRLERTGWWVEHLNDDGSEAPEPEWFWAHEDNDDLPMTPGEVRAWKATQAVAGD